MIEITPAILGPGIEEEYADALAAIDDMRLALGDAPLTNATPEGRVLLNAAWVKKQIEARRLPIPVDESFVGTIFYLVGSNELGHVPGFQEALGRLWLVLKGYGLMKPRHVPVLIAMIDDFVSDADRLGGLDEGARRLLADMRAQADDLRAGGAWPLDRPPNKRFTVQVTPLLRDRLPQCQNRLRAIQAPLFEAWRPSPARKPHLPAPVPGLPPTAPVLTPDVEARLP